MSIFEWLVGTALTSFLTLGIAKFSAFLIPRVVSSRRDVCSVQNAGSSVANNQTLPCRHNDQLWGKKGNDQGYMMLEELHREMHGRVMPPAMKCLIIDASEEGTALTVRRDTYGCELHRLAQPSSLSWSSACLTSSLLFCNTIRLNASPRSSNCSRSQEPMQPPLTLSMAACSALRSTPEAAEDEAAAARQQRRGAEELAVVGATSTATIAMAPSPRGSAAADRQR